LDERFKKLVKVGDYFEKKGNSNKCIIQRNYTIVLIDCYKLKVLDSILGDTLVRNIEKWDRKMINKWYLVNDTLSVKKLME